jgi:selenide,water dikinase
MGGKPLTVLNILAVPGNELDVELAGEILRGGQDKVAEAGAVVVGGHSVDDAEPKYGLSVTGTVHPDRVVTNAGARVGDRLVLTKPLGTGLMADAYMDGEMSEEAFQPAVASMVALNRNASEAMVQAGAHACTDVTGFGLLGHGREMAVASGVGLRIRAFTGLAIPAALELAAQRQGGGLRRNRSAFEADVTFAPEVSEPLRRLLFDPQTSGGLLISVPPKEAEALLSGLSDRQVQAWAVGEVVADHAGRIEVHA